MPSVQNVSIMLMTGVPNVIQKQDHCINVRKDILANLCEKQPRILTNEKTNCRMVMCFQGSGEMNIAKLCYELYKIDWMERIPAEQKKETLRNYYDEIAEDNFDSTEFTFEDYLVERGYNGECYVYFQEFFNGEFLDEEYMRELLTENQYIDYLKCVKDN